MPLDGEYSFECPECEYKTAYRTKLGGAFCVFWHFYKIHPDESFDYGNPLSDSKPPEFKGTDQ